jgi:hypothetical protein
MIDSDAVLIPLAGSGCRDNSIGSIYIILNDFARVLR